MQLKRLICAAAVVTGASAVLAPASALASTTITGAGSTLVAPLVAIWTNGQSAPLAPGPNFCGVTKSNRSNQNCVQFSAVGSGTGVKDVASGEVDFGASDAPSSAYTTCTVASGCVWFPWALSATAIVYHIPGVKIPKNPAGNGLRLTGKVLEQIFTGQITNWDSSAIRKLQVKHTKLPDLKITVVSRSDGSGDTYALTNFLAHVIGTGTASSRYGWPTIQPGSFVRAGGGTLGVLSNGNSGVAASVRSIKGAIGYVSGSYAIAQAIDTAKVQNAAGAYEYPTLTAIQAAAKSISESRVSATTGASIVDPTKATDRGGYRSAYPISTFTNVILPTKANLQSGHASTLKSFVCWAVTTGREVGANLDFVPIPAGVQTYDEDAIKGYFGSAC